MSACDKNDKGCKNTIHRQTNFDNTHNEDSNTTSCHHSGTHTCSKISTHDPSCAPFQLTKNNDNCFIESVVNENLIIGGADLFVYKLLGIHEQCKLVDQTGLGYPISNGDAPYFPASNAFDEYQTRWRSLQKGSNVLSTAYIGYDFGEIKLDDRTRARYGIETNIYKNIASLAIKQSSQSKNRVTEVRIERSNDNKHWYGVDKVSLPDNDCLNTVHFKQSVPSRYWRLRPTKFNGTDTDFWEVLALQLFPFVETNEDNIQDLIFLENRDREYSKDPLLIKGTYDLLDVQSELSKFGIELPSQTILHGWFSNLCSSFGATINYW